MEDSKSHFLPWDRFHNWIHCVCVVTFDLELGQAMELIYPNHTKLTDKEKLSICYLSFPDSNSGCTGNTKFHFRIRQCPSSKSLGIIHNEYNRNCPIALQGDCGYYYGFVYFRQMKDKSIRRGYFQKSVVIVTRIPFVNFFSFLIELVATQYFDVGMPSLEANCHNIDQWSSPVPGHTLNLPISGSIVQVRIPSRSDKLNSSTTQSKLEPQVNKLANIFIPSLHEVDTYTCFLPVLNHVQLLWELVLTAEPLVVMTSQPSVCSAVVQALVGAIWPLKYTPDYRPYFTIHDSEFKEYTSKTQAPPGIILGVTNPFFVKTLQHWPHVIRIGDLGESKDLNAASLTKTIGQLKKVSQRTLEFYPGVYTKYEPYLKRDKSILKKLMKGMASKRPVEVQNALLKRHLLELTQSFMIPLERYIGSLMPLAKNISPFLDAPQMKAFSVEEFIKTLENSGPQLTSGLKGDWAGLYRKFFGTSNFENWLNCRKKEIDQKLQILHIESLCQSDLMSWLSGKMEVQVVDIIIRMKDKIKSIHNQDLQVEESLHLRLKDKLNVVVSTLPPDLQTVLSY